MVVRINSASVDQLLALPGVGIKTAETLVGLREQYGHLTREVFSLVMIGEVSDEVFGLIDFSVASPVKVYGAQGLATGSAGLFDTQVGGGDW